jgi:hypothetical protein
VNHLSVLPAVRSFTRTATLLAVSLMFVACSSLIAPYNEASYRYATSLKPEALMLMGRATEEYAGHATEVDVLMLKVDQAYEYAAGLPNNEDSARQWEILKDPEGHLLGGFMLRWKDKGKLGAAFIENARKDTVGPAFDAIIALETLKIKQ